MFYISFIAEVLALITGLVLFRKLRPVAFRLIVVLLAVTVANEGCSYFGLYRSWGVSKNYFYTSFFIFEVLIFLFFYHQVIAAKKYRNFNTTVLLLTLLIGITFLVFYGFGQRNPFFLNTVCVGMLTVALSYFHLIYTSPKVYHLRKDPIFWISAGVIVAHFIYLLAVNAILVESFRDDPSSKMIFRSLNTLGNIIYYGFIITSFICSSKYQQPAGT